ncbi:MAG: shikimate dehydrogenase [Calditrichaceae bacterium]
MRQYGIIGYPLDHTFSPKIHLAAYRLLKMDAEYKKIEIEPSQFVRKIKALKSGSWSGFNVTIPYKEKITEYLDELDPTAEMIGAVNTIAVNPTNGRWKGYNTDYNGFLKPIRAFLAEIRSCLIFGAGGASRAVVSSLLNECDPIHVVIVNRTESKATNLVSHLQNLSAARIEFMKYNETEQIRNKMDIIVNTTSLGMGEAIDKYPADPVKFCHDRTVVYDLIYNPEESRFLKMAREAEMFTINGLPMLIGQAEAGFEIMTGNPFPEILAARLMQELK